MLGDEHPETLRCMFGLAIAHVEVSEVDVGLALCKEVFVLSQRILGDDHVDTRAIRTALDGLGLLLSELGLD